MEGFNVRWRRGRGPGRSGQQRPEGQQQEPGERPWWAWRRWKQSAAAAWEQRDEQPGGEPGEHQSVDEALWSVWVVFVNEGSCGVERVVKSTRVEVEIGG